VEIRIWFDQLDPPAGSLRGHAAGERRTGDRAEVTDVGFVGWLGLLRALERLIGSRDEPHSVE
jgi:hypothetical protein